MGDATAVADTLATHGTTLRRLLVEAGYRHATDAVAAHARYLHPETVAQAGRRAVLPTARSSARRGRIDLTADGRRIMLDDQRTSTWLFLRAAGLPHGGEHRVRHAWTDAENPDLHTALWNLHGVPAVLLDALQGSEWDRTVEALRYRAWELYGRRPKGEPKPTRPKGYKRLHFVDPLPPVDDLEGRLRAALQSSSRTLVADAVRQLGWCFSDFRPDPAV
jgi:hypothetical protein